MLLPITLLWPVIFLEGAANVLRWAHGISGCCCQLLCLGPSDFWEALPMHSDGPITLADAAANYFTLAHYICGRHCQFTQMGPLHQQMLLPMASIRPIIFWEALPMHSDGPITSLWPIVFLEGASNALRWAYCISGCCCQWLCFGPLFCSEALPIHSDGPIALADAANNCFTWAHQISGRHFRWAHCISRCCC